MYQTLTFYHSLLRWIVLLALGFALFRAWTGYRRRLPFTATDNAVRHWTATIVHVQLLVGLLLYAKSPMTRYFWQHPAEGMRERALYFFPVAHALLMLTAVVLVTLGSALAKRRKTPAEQFRTMLVYFSLSLLVILIAVPWPFSPLAARPWLR